jgi:hypothetical protein
MFYVDTLMDNYNFYDILKTLPKEPENLFESGHSVELARPVAVEGDISILQHGNTVHSALPQLARHPTNTRKS